MFHTLPSGAEGWILLPSLYRTRRTPEVETADSRSVTRHKVSSLPLSRVCLAIHNKGGSQFKIISPKKGECLHIFIFYINQFAASELC